MWWLMASAVATSAAGAYSAQQQAIAEQRRQFEMSRGDMKPWREAGKSAGPNLERLAAEHRARMGADTAKTLRDAKIGTILLLALFVTVAIGIGQLCGVIPVI